MAIKPQILAKLKHGKLICQAIYPTFVETWNWLVRFTSTIKGDFETNPQKGVIVVDRTDPDHPIIRLRQDRLPASKVWTGPFNPVTDEDGRVSGFEYCYFQVGGKTFHIDDVELNEWNCIAALKIPATTDGSAEDAEVLAYGGDESFSDLVRDQNNPAYEIIPLFVIDDEGKIQVDLRAIPTFQMEEEI